MKYKVFEDGTIKEVLNRMLKEGYIPCNSETTYKYRKDNNIKKWFDTRSLYIKGKFRDATLSELKNIEKTYDKGGRLVYLILINGGFYGDYDVVDIYGRFLGVKVNKLEKKR